jgi:hypothetical protein
VSCGGGGGGGGCGCDGGAMLSATRRVNRPLRAGEVLNVTVTNTMSAASFGGEKWLVLSTTSRYGTRNSFLGAAFIVRARDAAPLARAASR